MKKKTRFDFTVVAATKPAPGVRAKYSATRIDMRHDTHIIVHDAYTPEIN